MSRISNTFRRPALLLVSLLCVFAAGAALWSWISPETIRATRTTHLIGLLALFVLPVATLLTMEVDSRHRASRTGVDDGRSDADEPARSVRGRHEQRTLRHQRRDEGVSLPRRRTRARSGRARADHGC